MSSEFSKNISKLQMGTRVGSIIYFSIFKIRIKLEWRHQSLSPPQL